MNSISRTAKVIDKVCAVLYWVLIVCFVVIFIALLILGSMLLRGVDIFNTTASFTLSLGGLELLLAPGVMAELVSPGYETTLLVTVLFAIASIPVYFLMLLAVRDVLQPFIRQEPFHETVAKDLKRLSILVVADTVLCWIGAGLMNHLTRTYLNLEKLFLDGTLFGDRVIDVGVADASCEITPLLFAAALYLLSKVFLYGQELQTLSDETL